MSKSKFVSREIEGKGIGVVAVKSFEAGDLIIAEEPLFVVPWWIRHSAYPNQELRNILDKYLDELTEDQRQTFMSLSDCKTDENEEKTEMGIWRTNNFNLGRTTSKSSNGIFPKISRFNHSCVPSAEFAWNPRSGRQEVRAIRKIVAGEEILLCYFTSNVQMQPRNERVQYLLKNYGFECDCSACSLNDEKLAEDSATRLRIKNMKDKFDDLVYEYSDIEDSPVEEAESGEAANNKEEVSRDLEEAFALGLERLDLMDSLHFKCSGRLDFANEVFEVAMDLGIGSSITADAVDDLAKRGLRLASMLYGEDSDTFDTWKKRLL